jgi:hypothetical protein
LKFCVSPLPVLLLNGCVEKPKKGKSVGLWWWWEECVCNVLVMWAEAGRRKGLVIKRDEKASPSLSCLRVSRGKDSGGQESPSENVVVREEKRRVGLWLCPMMMMMRGQEEDPLSRHHHEGWRRRQVDLVRPLAPGIPRLSIYMTTQ